MKAIVLEDVGRLVCREVPEPEPARNEVKIKVICCGVCGSDIHSYEGKLRLERKPLIPGHEFSGIVTAVGNEVTKFKVGDRVTALPQRSGKDLTIVGVHVDGALAEYVCMEEKLTFPLPDNVSFEDGALIEPACVSGHAVFDYAQLLPCDDVVVMGAGPIGLMAVILAKACNARVFLLGRTTSADRLALGKVYGADYTFMTDKDDATKEILALTGNKGAKVVLETAGTDQSVAQSIDILSKCGKLIELALPSPSGITISNFLDIIHKEIVIQPSNCHIPENFIKVIDMLSSGLIRFDGYVTNRYSFDNFEDAFRTKGIKNLIYPEGVPSTL
jgi:L-iditol 2-dehydrogenase